MEMSLISLQDEEAQEHFESMNFKKRARDQLVQSKLAKGIVVRFGQEGDSPLSEQSELLSVDKTIDMHGDEFIGKYKVIDELGAGAFGTVYKVVDTETLRPYAMKVQEIKNIKKKLSFGSGEEEAHKLIREEMEMMKKIHHPKLVNLYEAIQSLDEQTLYLIMDLADLGYIGSKRYCHFYKLPSAVLPEDMLRRHMRDVLSGIFYLHNVAKIIHCDLKPENILTTKDGRCMITDFGVSRIFNMINPVISTNRGTRLFMGPEVTHERFASGRALDVWALGVTVFLLATGKYPFLSYDKQEFTKLLQDSEPEYPQHLSPPLLAFIKACLVKQPAKRATVIDLISHTWITKDGTDPIEDLNPAEVEVSEMEIEHQMNSMAIGTFFTVFSKLKKKGRDVQNKAVK